MKRFILALITILSIFGTSIKPASATSVNNFYFSDAEFDYYLEKTETGSKMHVKEVLTAEFPSTNQNHGITRSIPYSNQDGQNLTAPSKSDLNFTALRNGEKEPIAKSETEHGNYIFYLGKKSEYVHGQQVYTLEYDFSNVITEFNSAGKMTWKGNGASFQELYWDTNGTGWSQKFDHLIARVHIPADIAKNLIGDKTSCYVGKYGSNSSSSYRCTISSDDETTYNPFAIGADKDKSAEVVITFETDSLKAGENLTFAIDFDPGTFFVPEPARSMALVYIVIGSGAIMLFILLFAIYRYFQRISEKYRYKKTLFVTPQYTQPKGLTVADTEYLWLNTKKASLVATLIELAIDHKVELIKTEKEKTFGGTKTVWNVKVLSLGELTTAQKNVITILHGGENYSEGDTFKIEKHTASYHLQSLAREYRTSSSKRLEKMGLMVPSGDKKKLYSPSYAIFAIFLIIFYLFAALSVFIEYGSMLVGGGTLFGYASIGMILALIIIIAATARAVKIHRHTNEGIAASNEIDGLREYIKMAESDRLKFNQSVKGAPTSAKGIVKLYEKLLPYAIIFGEEESWMGELNKYYEQNPDIDHSWYSGSDYIAIGAFHSMVMNTNSSIRSSVSYTSSSSSSSGSSGGGGGGFSGGGGGGGGGGGW